MIHSTDMRRGKWLCSFLLQVSVWLYEWNVNIILFAKWMFFTLVNAEFLANCFKLTLILSRIKRKQAVILNQERTAIYHALTWEKKYWKLWQCLNSSANIDTHLLNNFYILKWNLGTSNTLYIPSAQTSLDLVK